MTTTTGTATGLATDQGEVLIAVPAGLFGDLVTKATRPATGTVGETVGTLGKGLFNQTPLQELSKWIANEWAPRTPSTILPFSVLPQSAGPGVAGSAVQVPQEQLIAVPAGLFGSLLKTLGGPIGGAIGGLFGNAGLGQQIGQTAGGIGTIVPFSVLPARPA